MTLHDLWKVSPQSAIFINFTKHHNREEYNGSLTTGWGLFEVDSVKATSYPMFRSVLEVTLKDVDGSVV